jgi:hypothetical protein
MTSAGVFAIAPSLLNTKHLAVELIFRRSQARLAEPGGSVEPGSGHLNPRKTLLPRGKRVIVHVEKDDRRDLCKLHVNPDLRFSSDYAFGAVWRSRSWLGGLKGAPEKASSNSPRG